MPPNRTLGHSKVFLQNLNFYGRTFREKKFSRPFFQRKRTSDWTQSLVPFQSLVRSACDWKVNVFQSLADRRLKNHTSDWKKDVILPLDSNFAIFEQNKHHDFQLLPQMCIRAKSDLKIYAILRGTCSVGLRLKNFGATSLCPFPKFYLFLWRKNHFFPPSGASFGLD